MSAKSTKESSRDLPCRDAPEIVLARHLRDYLESRGCDTTTFEEPKVLLAQLIERHAAFTRAVGGTLMADEILRQHGYKDDLT